MKFQIKNGYGQNESQEFVKGINQIKFLKRNVVGLDENEWV